MSKKDLVAIDIGNSRITFGQFRHGALVQTWYHPTNDPSGAAHLISEETSPSSIALSSVVPEATEVIKSHLSSNGKGPFEIEAGKVRLISGIYSTMGADRVANAVAGWKLYGQKLPVVVLDFGTATTLTAVTPDGKFAGGFITLGLGQTLSALHHAGAQLPRTTLGNKVTNELGFDTETAIVNGTFLAQLGIVEYWVRLARRSLKSDIAVVATGGWCEVVARHSSYVETTDPYLTLKGIYLIAEAAMDQADRG